MTTVILIAILIVLLILACTFGLLRRSGKKDRQQRDHFNDVMTSIAASNADPSIPLSAEAAAMLQQQYPYILSDQQLMEQQQVQQIQIQQQQQYMQQQQQHQHPGYLMTRSPSGSNVGMEPSSSGYSLRSPRHSGASSMHASPAHPSSSSHNQQQQQQSGRSSHQHHLPPRPSPAHFAAAAAAAMDPRFMPAPAVISMDRAAVACGSAEAEFQNDFIEVFPMQHLEPKPDLN